MTALGGYAATAITAVTVQNTLGVTGVHAIPLDVVDAQAQAVLDDIGADAIKTGMLATWRRWSGRAADRRGRRPGGGRPGNGRQGRGGVLEAAAVDAVRSVLAPPRRCSPPMRPRLSR